MNDLPDDKETISSKNYYSILPAKVRYCRNITANAKLLFSEFIALTNAKGYCWASNNYFASLYGVAPQAVSKWINELKAEGFISTVYIMSGKSVTERRVSINIDRVSTNAEKGINKGLKWYQQMIKDNIKVNTKENNTDEIFGDLIPSSLKTTEGFIEIWTDWVLYRKEIKKKLSLRMAKQQLKFLEKEADPNEVINQSIKNGWQGLFTVKDNSVGGKEYLNNPVITSKLYNYKYD